MERFDLPQRIVELLSRPNLTALPENPVGAIWEAFRNQFDSFAVVDLPESGREATDPGRRADRGLCMRSDLQSVCRSREGVMRS